jgi:hypothetical protein
MLLLLLILKLNPERNDYLSRNVCVFEKQRRFSHVSYRISAKVHL